MEPLEPLRLRLSRGVDEAHFRVGVSVPSQFGGGETESKLPFFENGVDWLRTVRNAVGANRFVPAIRLNELKPATFRELRAYLTEHRGDEVPHVIHFDGHGFFGTRCQLCREIYEGTKFDKCAQPCGAKLPKPQGYLLFEDKGGKANYVSAKELGTLMGKQRGVALVVLSACKSGLSLGSNSVFNGVAQNLISQRIPAVVAMQYSVLVDDATAFAEQFYRSLGERDSLAIAVSQGREAMGCEGNQWYRPVLYLRWKDNEGGQLFSRSELTTSLQPGLIEIEEGIQQFLSQLPSPSSTPPFREELQSLKKETYCYKQAERWLESEDLRLELAANVSKATLTSKSLGFYSTLEAKQEAEDDFEWNVYNCITCIFESFSTYCDKDIDDEFKSHLIENLDLYIDAMSNLKNEVERLLSTNKELIEVIHEQIDLLSQKFPL